MAATIEVSSRERGHAKLRSGRRTSTSSTPLGKLCSFAERQLSPLRTTRFRRVRKLPGRVKLLEL